MGKSKLLRKEFPKVRQFKKNSRYYYEVDCRFKDGNDQRRFTFRKQIDAFNKANEMGKSVAEQGLSTTRKFSRQLTDILLPLKASGEF